MLSGGTDVAAPDGGKWYDWETFGKYPGSLYQAAFGRTYAAGENAVYYLKAPGGQLSLASGARLYRCDADGSNPKCILTIDEPMEKTASTGNTLNVLGDFIWFSTDKAVYRVKTDGTGKVKLADKPASDMLKTGGKAPDPVYWGRAASTPWTITAVRSLGIVRQPIVASDNGVLYCGEQSADTGKMDLYFFDTATRQERPAV